MNNIVIAGGGFLGSQIAYQAAFNGKNVTIYESNDAAIESAKKEKQRFLILIMTISMQHKQRLMHQIID